MGFAANLNRLCQRAGDKAQLVVRRAALELQSLMIEASPVDTGRFKSNWQVGLGAINYTTSQSQDKDGSATIARSAGALESWVAGQAICLTNSLPYARRLEDGWSQQAPTGMVRLSVQRYGDALKAAVASLP